MLRTTVVGAITAVLLGTGLTTATAGDPDFGRVWRDKNGVLKEGCHDYRYQYRAKPPGDASEWALETFLVDKRGEGVAHGAFASNYDPRRGSGTFRVCEYDTVPGRFKLRGKLTWREGADQFERWVQKDFFRLRRDRS